MALNLGPQAFDAVTNLKPNPDWRRFVTALNEVMATYMHRSLEMTPLDRVDATGYARALRDLASHIEAIENPSPTNRNPRPPVKSSEKSSG